MTEFTKLVGDNSVLSSYTFTELQDYVIIRNEVTNHYFVFKSFELFESWYSCEKEKTYHEVIINTTQRLKFDIDINSTDVDDTFNITNVINTILNEIISTINESFEDFKVGLNDFIITDSSGRKKDYYKWSYHIILYRCALKNYIEARGLTNKVLQKLPDAYKKYIDVGVNKDNQCFRLLDSYKKDSPERIKKITDAFGTNTDVTLKDTMIRPFNGIRVLLPLEDVDILIDRSSNNISDERVKKILSIIKKYNIIDGHVYRNTTGNCINFNRVAPTYCTICDRIHHNDNTLIIYVVEDSIYEYCRHDNNNIRSRYICNINQDLDIDIKGILNKNVEKLLFDDLPERQKNIYDRPTMKPYELVSTLVIKAQMKVGKTKQLKEYINTHYNDSDSIIRFVTFRQTFSNHVNSLFDNFDSYNDIKGQINYNYKKVIIQVESLHRLCIDKQPIDLLILDEIESVLSQLSSGLHRHLTASLAIFTWLLSTAKRVICMDANVSNRTYNILSRFRKQKIFFHHNKFKASSGDNYFITLDKAKWIKKLHDIINSGKKIVMPTNSISVAKVCEEDIKTSFPKLNVKVFSSELNNTEKKTYFSDVHKYWSDLDILIYTPTCSAGVSYELETFDVLFAYFSNLSCDVETCRQMINRVRNIKTKEYYILLQDTQLGNLPTTVTDLHNFVYNKRLNISNSVKDINNIHWNYKDDGTINFYKTDYYYVWLENTIMTNLSKVNFIERFCIQICESGGKISKLITDTVSKLLVANFNSIKAEIRERENKLVIESTEIDRDEYMSIIKRINNHDEVSMDEKRAIEKYNIKRDFDITTDLNPDLIKFYRNCDIKRIYKNLSDIAKEKTIDLSIKTILEREKTQYNTVVSCEGNYSTFLEYMDLHNDKKYYTVLCHLVVSHIIKLLGTKKMEKEEYEEIFNNEILDLLNKNEEYLSIELDVNLTDDKKNNVKKLLTKMYGLSIYQKDNKIQLRKCINIEKVIVFAKEINPNKITIITENEIFLSLK